jgi:hypothetical protein
MIKELDPVALTTDLPAENLAKGDLGTVVHVHKGGTAFIVEFLTLRGNTIAVTTLKKNQIRAVSGREVAHARDFSKA